MRSFATDFVTARLAQHSADQMRAAGYSLPPAVGDAPAELRRNTPAPVVPKARCRVLEARFMVAGRPVRLGEVLELDADLVRDLEARGLVEGV